MTRPSTGLDNSSLTRAYNEYESLAVVMASITDSLLVSWCRHCRALASDPNPWASTTVLDALSGLVEAVGSRCDPKKLLRASGVLGLGNRLTAPLSLAIDRAAVQATQAEPVGGVRAEALNNYAISLAEVGRRDEALDPAREAVDAYRGLAEANPAAYTPNLAASLNNYANRLAEMGRRDEAIDPAREAVDAYRGLAEANPAIYAVTFAQSLHAASELLNANNLTNEASAFRAEADAWITSRQSTGH